MFVNGFCRWLLFKQRIVICQREEILWGLEVLQLPEADGLEPQFSYIVEN